MTNPQQADDAFNALAGLAAGNQNVTARPQLLQSLVNGGATRGQVSAINQFVGGLQAESAVQKLRESGQKIVLPTNVIQNLDAIGAQYSDVNITPAQAQAQAVSQIKKQGLVPVFVDGQLAGARNQNEQEQNAHQDGWFDSFGGFFHHLLHNPVTNVIGEGWNIVETAVAGVVSPGDDDANAKLMKALGYDPNSIISTLAFDAKGFERSNLDPLINKYGIDKIAQAEQYLQDPKRYTEQAIHDANKADPSGQAARDAVAQISSKQFGEVLQEVGGRSRSIGALVANAVGLDPVSHPEAWAWTSGGIDFVTSFVLDPTLLALKGAKAIKVAQIGLRNGAFDINRMGAILDKSNGSLYARRVQNNVQLIVDSGNLIREGDAARATAAAAGDLRGVATAEARVNQGYSTLRALGAEALTPVLTGKFKLAQELLDRDHPGYLKFVEGGTPVDTYDKFFQHVVATHAMTALVAGKTGIEASFMPFALSRFGATRIRAALTGLRTGRKAEINFRTLEGARMLPAPDDAVDYLTGAHLSTSPVDDLEASGLASQRRALPSPAQIGLANYNRLRYGNVSGTGLGGVLGKSLNEVASAVARRDVSLPIIGDLTPGSWINPRAIAARTTLARARLINKLPRNDTLNLLDEQGAQKIYALAKTYLPTNQSLMLGAAFANGSVGARRAIAAGMVQQIFHTAGMAHSAAGRKFMDEFFANENRVYAHTPEGQMALDPVTGERDVPVAVWNAQNRLEYEIPSFLEMHQLAAKFGFYEALLGRLFTSHALDVVWKGLRFGWLFTPRTGVRASTEGWLNLLLRGDAAGAIASKARSSELDAELAAEREAEARGLSVEDLLKLPDAPHLLPKRTRALVKATGWWLPRMVGSYVRRLEKRGLSDLEDEYLERMIRQTPELASAPETAIRENLIKVDINPETQGQSAWEIARAGAHPALYEHEGWKPLSTDGWIGAHRLEAALKLRQHGNPKTFAAILEHLANPTVESLDGVRAALRDPKELTGFQRTRWSEGYLDPSGVVQRALTKGEKDLALDQHAARMIDDLRHLVTQPDGRLSPVLMKRLRSGEPYDGEWIHAHLDDALRPQSAIAPELVPKLADDVDDVATAKAKIAAAIQDLTGVMYDRVVARPTARMTSVPAFWNNYLKSRVRSSEWEKQVVAEGHFDAKTVDRLLAYRSFREAAQRTEYTVDDPGLKTQFDIVARNLTAFPRAVNAFLRRYGQLAKQNPEAVRKAFLALQGAEHMGFVYRNQDGELVYTVPASGFLVNSLNEIGRWMGWENFIALPAGDLQGNVLMSAPGFDAPFRMSASPIVNIPFRFFANMFPDHREMLAEIDTVMNGSKGSGRDIGSQLTPAAVSHIWEAMSSDDRESLLASTTIAAISNIIAADPNGEKGILPKPGTDPTGQKMNEFWGTVKTQVRSQFYVRAFLGEFLPAAVSRPSEAFASRADEAYFIRGARTMSDEFKLMIDDFGGDYQAALQSFIALHPNGTVYTQPTSTVTKAGVTLPATRPAEAWMEQNHDLIEKFPLIAVYFAPKNIGGNFDANAYQSQLDLGIRKKKSIQEFVDQWQLARGQKTYFDAYQQMKQIEDQFNAAGNSHGASLVRQNFTEQMAPFLAINPLLKDYLTTSDGTKAVQGQQAIRQLRELVQTGQIANLNNGTAAAHMLQAFDEHQQFQLNKSANDDSSRQAERRGFGLWMEQQVLANPDLVGLYNVFRAVDFASLPSIRFGDNGSLS